jgi:NitT/TauT family transport system substrate-binding protein
MRITIRLLTVAIALVITLPVFAADKVKVAIGQRGLWDTMATAVGVKEGLFAKENLDVEIVWTRGGSETLQAVITGSTAFAMTNGILGVLSAYEKGAPVRIVSAEMTGAPDLFWYAKSDSGINSIADVAGKTIGFSRPGSSTNLVLLGLLAHAKVTAKPTPTGGISATRTQVMSGQINAGWSVPPFNLDLVREGKIKIIARGSDLPSIHDQTIRVNVVNANVLKNNRDLVKRFMRGYAAAIDFMYKNQNDALKIFASMNKISPDVAKDAIKFYPREALQPWKIKGIDASMKQAVEYKRLSKPLTKSQLNELIEIVEKPKS